MTSPTFNRYFSFFLAALFAFTAMGFVAPHDAEAKRKKKYQYGQRYKKKQKKGKKRSARGSTCIPCVGKNRQCEQRKSEMHCKACNAYREAFSDYNKYMRRKNPTIAWAAIVEVNRTVIARSQSGIYPRDICSVIHQPYQFSWTLCPKTCVSDRDWAIVWKAAQDAKTSNGKMNYHAAYVTPGWSRNCKGRNQIGTHIYYDNCTGGKRHGKKQPRNKGPKKQRQNNEPRTNR